MEVLDAVSAYLKQHWKNCRCSATEKEADLKYYEGLPEPYGPGFVKKLRNELRGELK